MLAARLGRPECRTLEGWQRLPGGAKSESAAEDLGAPSTFFKSTCVPPGPFQNVSGPVFSAVSWRPGLGPGLCSARSLPFLSTQFNPSWSRRSLPGASEPSSSDARFGSSVKTPAGALVPSTIQLPPPGPRPRRVLALSGSAGAGLQCEAAGAGEKRLLRPSGRAQTCCQVHAHWCTVGAVLCRLDSKPEPRKVPQRPLSPGTRVPSHSERGTLWKARIAGCAPGTLEPPAPAACKGSYDLTEIHRGQ